LEILGAGGRIAVVAIEISRVARPVVGVVVVIGGCAHAVVLAPVYRPAAAGLAGGLGIGTNPRGHGNASGCWIWWIYNINSQIRLTTIDARGAIFIGAGSGQAGIGVVWVGVNVRPAVVHVDGRPARGRRRIPTAHRAGLRFGIINVRFGTISRLDIWSSTLSRRPIRPTGAAGRPIGTRPHPFYWITSITNSKFRRTTTYGSSAIRIVWISRALIIYSWLVGGLGFVGGIGFTTTILIALRLTRKTRSTSSRTITKPIIATGSDRGCNK